MVAPDSFFPKKPEMRLSAFLSIACSFASPIQFLDFWTESDVFAIRIQRSLPSDKGDTFWKNYDNVRQAIEFYQDSGPCDYFMQDPSFELVEEKAFSKDLSLRLAHYAALSVFQRLAFSTSL